MTAALPFVAPAGPLVITMKRQAVHLLLIGLGTFAVGLFSVVWALVGEPGNTTSLVVSLVVGSAFSVLGLRLVIGFPAARRFLLVIGPEGIFVRRSGGDTSITWQEVGAVGLSVTWSRGPAPSPRAVRTRAVLRIRIAPVVPGFGGRLDMVRLVTHDEPAPYTHKIVVPPGKVFTTETDIPKIETLAGALACWAPQKFTGVDYRRTVVGRYS